MDVLLSIVTGLGLRLFLNGLDGSLGRIAPILLGLWEGAAVYHLSTKSSVDHYLAYALRIAIDLYFTANLHRAFTVLLCTTIGFVASDTLNPQPPPRVRRKTSRSSNPLHPTRDSQDALPPSSTPAVRPSRPPTPPSFFLQDESEVQSPHPSHSNDDPATSPPPKPILLPTPPLTLTSEAREVRTAERISTIEEHTSDAESSRRSVSRGVPSTYAIGNLASYTSAAVTPLPIPNSTLRYLSRSVDQPKANSSVESSPTAPEAPPLPVPNPGVKYYMSEDEGGDPLQTPPAAGAARWELVLTDDNDGLTTPPARELSPLVLEQSLLPSFGQAATAAEAVTNDIASGTTTEAAAAHLDPSAVESFTAIVPSPSDPDPTLGSRPGSTNEHESKPDVERVSPYPTPIPTPVVERPSDGQKDEPDNAGTSNDVDEDAEQETETETDATSVISSHPANVMFLRAEALRAEARAAEEEYSRLQWDFRKARGVQALFLRQKMREEEDRAKKLHGKAAKRFFEARNALRKRYPNTIDVHGLRVAEAVLQTEQAVRDALAAHAPSVRVIVGKGLHSAAGVPVIKNTIMRTMQGYNVPCKVDPANAGALILTLPES
ncbi:hypothetical protein H0H92_012439 [Tricholoma furcatifolium]|nr:hypothetical protein H0H92_012439 [Tricholoma furcatifolium]